MLHPKSVNQLALREGKPYMLYITNPQYGSVLSPEFVRTLSDAHERARVLRITGLIAKVFEIKENGDLTAA